MTTDGPVVLCKPMDTAQLALVKGVLQSEDIEYFVEHENMSTFHAKYAWYASCGCCEIRRF